MTTAAPARVSLNVHVQGDRSGVPVVFLHGLSDSRRSWDLVLPRLPASLRAIAVSQRGHGNSERPLTGYRMRDLASDVVELLDSLAIERAVIVGHSMGSTVARRFASDHPERTLGLVLVASFAAFAGNPAVEELSGIAAELEDPLDPGFVREFQESTLGQPIAAAFLELLIDESCKVPAGVFRKALAGLLGDDVADDLAGIGARTLVVWGDRDAYCPREDQAAITSAIPGAELSVFEGSGHAPHWEQPERFAEELARFAERLA
jgi:non-heme chloroperoxidase